MEERTSTWLNEVLDVLEHRRPVVVATAVGVAIVGLVAALVVPGVMPPNPLVGAAVGMAAVLLAVAVALGVDSVDLTVRGVRHVRAAGAEAVANLPGRPNPDATAPLAEVLTALDRAPLRVALSPASRSISTVGQWTDALAVELSRRDQRVVVLDLASGPDLSGHPGVLEVVRDGVRLGEAVRFDPDLLLARLGPGADDEAALAAWPRLAGNIPSDVDVLLVALPPVTQPGVLAALGSTDLAWLFASIDRTARVDLIAGLDAADRTGTPTEVVLLDPSRERPAPTEVGVAGLPAVEAPVDGYDPSSGVEIPEPPPEPDPGTDEIDHPETGSALAELSSLAATGSFQVEPDEATAPEEPAAEAVPPEEMVEHGPPPQEIVDAEPPAEPDDRPEDVVESEPPAEPDDRPEGLVEPEPPAEPDDRPEDLIEPEPPADVWADETTEVADLDATDDATDELPTVVLDDPVDEPDLWSPLRDDSPRPRHAPPLAGPDDAEDPVRVAAALQTLAQEVWSRDDEA